MIDPNSEFEGTEPALTPQLTAHPAANDYPMMIGVEFAELVADIKKNGLQQPIVLFKGQILDGRNRYKACLEAEVPLETKEFDGSDKDAVAFIKSANLHRRHLTPAQKQEIVAKALAANPEKSDHAIGRLAHVDHKTVSAKRAALEATGEIPRVERRKDEKGRSYASHKVGAPSSASGRRGIGSGSLPREAQESKAVLAYLRVLHHGDIHQHLNELVGMLHDEKDRIAALPKIQRISLARAFLGVLNIVGVDDLKPIIGVPVFEDALRPAHAES